MRAPNSFGSIKKLSGKRRRPYAFIITCGWEIVDGKKRQKQRVVSYHATRQEAMIARAEYNKSPFDLDQRNITFEQVYEVLYKEKFEKMKRQAKSGYTASFGKCDTLHRMKMIDIKKYHMQAVVDRYADMSKSTQMNIIKLFHAMFSFALENDIVEKDYSRFVEATSVQVAKDKVPFTREEVAVLWQHEGNWIAESLLILLYTGVRIEELLTLKAADVNIEERYIDLRGTKTKAAKRLVPIHKKIVPLLDKRLTSTYLYPSVRTAEKPMTYNPYRDKLDPFLESVNMKHTPHECRHTFTSMAHACKLNPVLIKKIIGHAAQDLTQDTYTHAFIEDLLEEIDKFEY